jgi:hypothetical protein
LPDEVASRHGNASGGGDEYPVADFLEPIQYEWTEADYEVRQAIKRYSEGAQADS